MHRRFSRDPGRPDRVTLATRFGRAVRISRSFFRGGQPFVRFRITQGRAGKELKKLLQGAATVNQRSSVRNPSRSSCLRVAIGEVAAGVGGAAPSAAFSWAGEATG